MINEFIKLNPLILKWIHNQEWKQLKDIQNQSIDPILSKKTDVLISASTASGKTEAFFLPACHEALKEKDHLNILYISPLKALINDQYRRLESLAHMLDLQVVAWHGDSSQTKKKKFKKSPSGILLITPESLESMLIRNSSWVSQHFSHLQYIVIDEFHAFLGTERGHHLLSLLNRLEHLVQRYDNPIPRVALSATLGDLQEVPKSLRSTQDFPCIIIEDKSGSSSNFQLQVKGYYDPIIIEKPKERQPKILGALDHICNTIFKICRGKNHLVFANSRRDVEMVSVKLKELSESKNMPNEFFPHHGSLSKELREDLEARLQKDKYPTTAICTVTLELGMDIGKIFSVLQLSPPHSVSSLRQRMGRSGRQDQDNVSKLRLLIIEKELETQSSINDQLRLDLIQSLAMIRLLLKEKWFEPADTSLYHFSTLVHQILSVIKQWGGITAKDLYTLLCVKGIFNTISVKDFSILLKELGKHDLITQSSNTELVLGLHGEQITDHYSFYAVFQTPVEYRLVNGSKTIGSLSIDKPVQKDEHIIFAGQRWIVIDVDTEKKSIYITNSKGGNPPVFDSNGLFIHDKIYKEMFNILKSKDYRIQDNEQYIDFADNNAKYLFNQSVNYFTHYDLANNFIIQKDENVYIFPWLGTKVINTISCLLKRENYCVCSYSGIIRIEKADKQEIKQLLRKLSTQALPSATDLAKTSLVTALDKFDEYLPKSIQEKNFGQIMFDTQKTKKWLTSLKF